MRLPLIVALISFASAGAMTGIVHAAPAPVTAKPADKKPEAKPDSKPDSKVDSKAVKEVHKKKVASLKKLPVLPGVPMPKAAEKKDSKKTSAGEEPPPELTGALPYGRKADKKTSDKKESKKEESKAAKKEDDRPATIFPAKKDGSKKDAKADKKTDSKKPEADRKSGRTASLPSDKKFKACFHPAVSLLRLGAPAEAHVVLTDCKGEPAPFALDNLSILARPYDVPTAPSLFGSPALLSSPASRRSGRDSSIARKKSLDIAPGIRRLDEGLVTRIQAIADKFPGKTITLVSGYRPASKGSPHAAGHATDVRLEGVTNEALVSYCKTLKDTGCGYYPNSSFVHVDVRAEGTGHVYWIDVSGPGEKPSYVKDWPAKSKLPSLPDDKTDKAVDGEVKDGPKDSAFVVPTTDKSEIGPHVDHSKDEDPDEK